jgi:hypothetical protein
MTSVVDRRSLVSGTNSAEQAMLTGQPGVVTGPLMTQAVTPPFAEPPGRPALTCPDTNQERPA